MTKLLALVPLWVWIALAVAASAFAGQGIYDAGVNSEIARNAKHTQDITGQLNKARQERDDLKTSQDKAREQVAYESFIYSEKLQAAATDSRNALERLRIAAANATRRSAVAPQGASAPAGCTPVNPIVELLTACATEHQRMGVEADRDHAAGLKCERTYDTLTVPEADATSDKGLDQ